MDHPHHHPHHPPRPPVREENLLGMDRLAERFGTPGDPSSDDIVGDRHLALLAEMAHIVAYQWRDDTGRGPVKGMLLAGPPGTGKSTLAQRLAYELGLRPRQAGEPGHVTAMLVDGGEIARARYGESEERIRDIFAYARSAPGRTVLVLDDVESILMARGSAHAKEWHFSQDSVFFHEVDRLDPKRAVLVLTTNRPDLVDDAIRDRFLEYRLDHPSARTLADVATRLALRHGFTPARLDHLLTDLRRAHETGTIRSLRQAERFVLQHYVAHALGRPSLAEGLQRAGR